MMYDVFLSILFFVDRLMLPYGAMNYVIRTIRQDEPGELSQWL